MRLITGANDEPKSPDAGDGQPKTLATAKTETGGQSNSAASETPAPQDSWFHSFELTSLAGKPTAGILKDVVMLGGYQEAEVDFVAYNPGLTLFHCHQQLHM